ncbi:MAG: NAD(P)-dependent oxidoreductase, partial [Armatimonadetes bacterium]
MSAVTPSTSRRTILVTGATGYIGSHLVRSLHEA